MDRRNTTYIVSPLWLLACSVLLTATPESSFPMNPEMDTEGVMLADVFFQIQDEIQSWLQNRQTEQWPNWIPYPVIQRQRALVQTVAARSPATPVMPLMSHGDGKEEPSVVNDEGNHPLGRTLEGDIANRSGAQSPPARPSMKKASMLGGFKALDPLAKPIEPSLKQTSKGCRAALKRTPQPLKTKVKSDSSDTRPLLSFSTDSDPHLSDEIPSTPHFRIERLCVKERPMKGSDIKAAHPSGPSTRPKAPHPGPTTACKTPNRPPLGYPATMGEDSDMEVEPSPHVLPLPPQLSLPRRVPAPRQPKGTPGCRTHAFCIAEAERGAPHLTGPPFPVNSPTSIPPDHIPSHPLPGHPFRHSLPGVLPGRVRGAEPWDNQLPTGPNDRVFIGGLRRDVEPKKLHNYFAKYGEVKEIIIKRNSKRLSDKSYAFLTFADPDSASIATGRHPELYLGCDVKLAYPTILKDKRFPKAGGPY